MIKKTAAVLSAYTIFLLTGAMMFGCVSKQSEEHQDKSTNPAVAGITFAGNEYCKECHGRLDTIKMSGFHKEIDCEKCHGPGSLHLSDPIIYKMSRPLERVFCVQCHASDSGKSADIKQIDAGSHNAGKRCISCHSPHTGGFGLLDKLGFVPTSSTCNMCHSKVNGIRLKGAHKGVECQSCHAGWEKHLENQKEYKPQKSTERSFCGRCHSKDQPATPGKIKKIDMKEHNPEAKCVECHNAHSPWD